MNVYNLLPAHFKIFSTSNKIIENIGISELSPLKLNVVSFMHMLKLVNPQTLKIFFFQLVGLIQQNAFTDLFLDKEHKVGLYLARNLKYVLLKYFRHLIFVKVINITQRA